MRRGGRMRTVHSLSAETPTVSCLPRGSNRSTPSPFNFKHSCKHLLVSPSCICVGKYHPFLFAYVQTRPPLVTVGQLFLLLSCITSPLKMKSLWRWKADIWLCSVWWVVGGGGCWLLRALWRRDLQVRNVRFWQTNVRFIQVVPDVISKQRSWFEQHQDSIRTMPRYAHISHFND